MPAKNLTVIAPAYSRKSANLVVPLPLDAFVPEGTPTSERKGHKMATLQYTYPGGPEPALYLVAPADRLEDADFGPAGPYHGAYRWGAATAIPRHTLRPGRLLVVGATAEEQEEALAELLGEDRNVIKEPEPEPAEVKDPAGRHNGNGNGKRSKGRR